MDSKNSSKRGKANLRQQYVSSTNPFVHQQLPYPYQNQQFPQHQPFNQQQQFPQPQIYLQPYPYLLVPIQLIHTVQMNLHKYPINTTCPACKKDIVTSVRMEANITTQIVAGVLCLLGLCPCALIPYCIDSCKSAVHSCPDCRAYIGTYDTTRCLYYYRGGRR